MLQSLQNGPLRESTTTAYRTYKEHVLSTKSIEKTPKLENRDQKYLHKEVRHYI